MPAYIVFTREKTRNAEALAKYKDMAPTAFEGHSAVIRASHGRKEVLEGPAAEEILILEFPGYEEAKAWYDSPAYQAACEHRFQGGDYRAILTDGIASA